MEILLRLYLQKTGFMLIYLKLIRLKQWIKNLFIFVPAFFAGDFLHFALYPKLLLGFLSFSLTASAIYIFNDYRDREVDRQHPVKRFRPLASGEANVTVSLVLEVVLLISGVAIAYFLDTSFLLLLISYIIINISYTIDLKNISILDIFLVASGFIIRVYAGGVLANVEISHWLVLMIMLLSLFLALSKRRDDIVLGKNGTALRKSSTSYNLEFINSCLSIFSGVIIVAYIMYTVSPEITERLHSEWLFLTTIFVIAGIMRYLQITFVEEKSGSPNDVLLKDRFILITIIGWIISFYVIIYLRNVF